MERERPKPLRVRIEPRGRDDEARRRLADFVRYVLETAVGPQGSPPGDDAPRGEGRPSAASGEGEGKGGLPHV